ELVQRGRHHVERRGGRWHAGGEYRQRARAHLRHVREEEGVPAVVGRREGVLAREVQGRRAGGGEGEVHRPQGAGHRVAQGIDGGDGNGSIVAGGDLRRRRDGETDGAAGAVIVAGRVVPDARLTGPIDAGVADEDIDRAVAVGIQGGDDVGRSEWGSGEAECDRVSEPAVAQP